MGAGDGGNGAGNGNGKHRSHPNSLANLKPPFKPGHVPPRCGIKKGYRSPKRLYQHLLADRGFRQDLCKRLRAIAREGSDKELLAMVQEFRKTLDGDKLSVEQKETFEVDLGAGVEDRSPVPPAPGADRLPPGGGA